MKKVGIEVSIPAELLIGPDGMLDWREVRKMELRISTALAPLGAEWSGSGYGMGYRDLTYEVDVTQLEAVDEALLALGINGLQISHYGDEP